jgi:hypothetical protein
MTGAADGRQPRVGDERRDFLGALAREYVALGVPQHEHRAREPGHLRVETGKELTPTTLRRRRGTQPTPVQMLPLPPPVGTLAQIAAQILDVHLASVRQLFGDLDRGLFE